MIEFEPIEGTDRTIQYNFMCICDLSQSASAAAAVNVQRERRERKKEKKDAKTKTWRIDWDDKKMSPAPIHTQKPIVQL